MELKILNEQPTPEKPIIINNYPYGFKLRTSIKYYVETTSKGQRFVSQTLNPKTNKWNAEKKSVYSNIILIGKDEREYINYINLNMYSKEEAQKFKEKYLNFLNEYQKKELNNILSLLEVYDKVEYKITTRKFKNIYTNEIKEIISVMELKNYIEVDEQGNAINKEDEERKQREIRELINKQAVLNAVKNGSTINEGIETLRRS